MAASARRLDKFPGITHTHCSAILSGALAATEGPAGSTNVSYIVCCRVYNFQKVNEIDAHTHTRKNAVIRHDVVVGGGDNRQAYIIIESLQRDLRTFCRHVCVRARSSFYLL